MLPAVKKNVLSANQRSMVIYEYVCHCDSRYIGRKTLRLQEHIKQCVSKAIRQTTKTNQNQGTHRSQPNKTQPIRKCKAKSETQYEPKSNSAVDQCLLKANQSALNYSDLRFKILTTDRSSFYLSLLEVVNILYGKKKLYR